jgi:hypothetical protein
MRRRCVDFAVLNRDKRLVVVVALADLGHSEHPEHHEVIADLALQRWRAAMVHYIGLDDARL